jgi:hypothetical protein
MPNTEMLLKLRGWVREQWERKEAGLPSEWLQAEWARKTDCGTVCCVAGKTALMAGWKPVFFSGTDTALFKKRGRGEQVASEIARDVLDLDWYTGETLFDARNTVEDIERIIDQIIAGTLNVEAWSESR